MSIMPAGGWVDLGQQEPRPEQGPNQGSRNSSRGYLTCKVCERGNLSSKKVFRLSGPAVVIGFILLIPSIVGMILSALMLLGVIAVTGAGVRQAMRSSNGLQQSTFDSIFRQNCARNFRRSFEATSGNPAPLSIVEGYCECALSTFKETASEEIAAQTCSQEVADGTVAEPSEDVAAFYMNYSPNQARGAAAMRREDVGFFSLFGFLGGVSAIALGITSFVGGLLGWLLVMRKRVLQCDLCSAVVNAS